MASFNGKFKSTRQDWTTPPSLFEKLNAEFGFTIDLAASKDNSLCGEFFDEQDDALSRQWTGIGWLNPPYGAGGAKLSKWVAYAFEQTRSNEGSCVVMLIPARTNTRWFHKFCLNASEIRLICGRPKFGGAEHGLPQPLAVVVFKKTDRPVKVSSLELP